MSAWGTPKTDVGPLAQGRQNRVQWGFSEQPRMKVLELNLTDMAQPGDT